MLSVESTLDTNTQRCDHKNYDVMAMEMLQHSNGFIPAWHSRSIGIAMNNRRLCNCSTFFFSHKNDCNFIGYSIDRWCWLVCCPFAHGDNQSSQCKWRESARFRLAQHKKPTMVWDLENEARLNIETSSR